MKINRSIKVFGRAIFAMASLVFIGCEKNTGELGLEQIADESVVLGPVVELPIISYTKQIRPVAISNPSQLMTGGYDDPIFGRANAKHVIQYKLTELSPDFGDKPICDSVFLVLPFSGFGYGDTSQSMELVVKEITKDIFINVNYRTDADFAPMTELGRFTTTPRTGVEFTIGSDTVYSGIKMPLDPAFFQSKILEPSRLGSQYFSSNSNFIRYFKGIEVSAENAQSIQFFDPGNPNMIIRMFYRESSADSVAREYDFDVNFRDIPVQETFYLNLFEQDYTNAVFNLDMQDTINGEPLVFNQTMSGVNTVIKLPEYLVDMDTILVNKAELLITLREGQTMPYLPPSIMYLRELDTDSLEAGLFTADYGPDPIFPNIDNVGGLVTKEQIRVFRYAFRMTSHINAIIRGDRENLPILVLPNAQRSSANRTVMNGNNSSEQKMTLKLYYTKLPSN